KNTAAKLITIDYCEHSQALQWLRSASSLCLLLSDVPGADRVVPAKLFEYLAIRKDMLTISPSGETAEIVRRFYPQGQFAPNQGHEISNWLKQRLSTIGDSQPTSIDESALDEFSRKSQTRKLADLLNTLVASHSRGRGN
ncbi:MAG TPA: hypothetical protein VGM98_08300, partial [Schlesneria sp.]